MLPHLFETAPSARTVATPSDLRALARPGLPRDLIATFLFMLAYGYQPLYASTQNTYFLHGIAWSGFGQLDRDWLANTQDPTPVFSLMVEGIFGTIGAPGFYFVQLLLTGLYALSLIRIAQSQTRIGASFRAYALFVLGLLIVHSEGVGYVVQQAIGLNTTNLFSDGVAQQTALGHFLQPSSFGVCILASIALFLERRLLAALLVLALAPIFHPTYLIGASLVAAAYLAFGWKQSLWSVRTLALHALLFGLLVLPIALYALLAFRSASPDQAVAARDILVNFRIPHHAKVSHWFGLAAVLKIAIVLAGAALAKGPLRWILLLVFSVSALLTLVQVATGSTFLALLFPWRTSVFLVPTGTALLLAWASAWLAEQAWFHRLPSPAFLAVSLLVIAATIGLGGAYTARAARLDRTESGMWAFVRGHAGENDLYLVPPDLEKFRLQTGIPVFIDGKSHPYRDVEVLEWYRRLRLTEALYRDLDHPAPASCADFQRRISGLGLTDVLAAGGSRSDRPCPFLSRQWSDGHYALYKVAPAS